MAISWTKTWAGADDGTILKGADLANLQSDIAANIGDASSIQGFDIDVPVAGDDTWVPYYDHANSKFDYKRVADPSGTPVQGDVIYYNGTNWIRLGQSTAGKVLRTEGAAANPTFGYPADLTIASQAHGDILYYSGTAWVRLAHGTDGEFLKTQGAGANPVWDAAGHVEIFTANGTFTAPAGIVKVALYMCGGGGGGGTGQGGGGKGGGGGGAESWIGYGYTVTPASDYVVVVGAGGTVAADGGNSTFDASVTARGGNHGITSGGDGAGGAAMGGLDGSGATGGKGVAGGAGADAPGGSSAGGGGSSVMGVAGNGKTTNAGAGSAGTGFGAGGGGGYIGAGGVGSSGVVIVVY